MPERIKVCPREGEPVTFTLDHRGAEYLCQVCGWLGGVFSPMEAEASEALVARRDELEAKFERERGITPPDQDQPAPSCMGCGLLATGRLDRLGKPAHWYTRKVDGLREYACSRDCISDGLVMPW